MYLISIYFVFFILHLLADGTVPGYSSGIIILYVQLDQAVSSLSLRMTYSSIAALLYLSTLEHSKTSYELPSIW
jgi:hypothetical protein